MEETPFTRDEPTEPFSLPQLTLSQEQQEVVRARLLDLLAQRVRNYTMGDSTSVREETAQELMRSVMFSVQAILRGRADAYELLCTGDARAVFAAAWAEIERELASGRKMLAHIRRNPPPVTVRAYRDTVSALAEFFKRYDYRFFAHNIPCDIDYQLAIPVPESLQGILYINTYLRSLLAENAALACFAPEALKALLRGVSSSYDENLMAMFEPVLTCAVGCVLLQKEPFSLPLTSDDRQTLTARLKEMPQKVWDDAARALCKEIPVGGEATQNYAFRVLSQLFPSARAAVRSGGEAFFPLPQRKTQRTAPPLRFEDALPMADERLRALIGEMAACRFVSDKIEMMRREVRSLRDACELLNVCFWGEECAAYFRTLDEGGLSLLMLYVKRERSKKPGWASDSGWEHELARYTAGLDARAARALRPSCAHRGMLCHPICRIKNENLRFVRLNGIIYKKKYP